MLWLGSVLPSARRKQGVGVIEAIENIALMVALMVLGIGVTWAVLLGFIYYMEAQND